MEITSDGEQKGYIVTWFLNLENPLSITSLEKFSSQ